MSSMCSKLRLFGLQTLLLLLLHQSRARLLVKTRQDDWHMMQCFVAILYHPVPCVGRGAALTALSTPHRDVM